MDKNFEERIDFLKKEINELRNMVGMKYSQELRDKNNNGLIFLKRNRDKIAKTAEYLFRVKPIKGKNRMNFGKMIKDTMDNLVKLSSVLEKELQDPISRNDIPIMMNNMDNMKLALKCLKTLDLRNFPEKSPKVKNRKKNE